MVWGWGLESPAWESPRDRTEREPCQVASYTPPQPGRLPAPRIPAAKSTARLSLSTDIPRGPLTLNSYGWDEDYPLTVLNTYT